MKGCSVHRESVARWTAMLGRRVLLVTRMIEREQLRLETLERAGGLPAPPLRNERLLTSAVLICRTAKPH